MKKEKISKKMAKSIEKILADYINNAAHTNSYPPNKIETKEKTNSFLKKYFIVEGKHEKRKNI